VSEAKADAAKRGSVLAHQEKRCYSAMRLTLSFRSGPP
jgi:hypothetical protein